MIYVPFFPLQIPIYFEFLPLTRYEFVNCKQLSPHVYKKVYVSYAALSTEIVKKLHFNLSIKYNTNYRKS